MTFKGVVEKKEAQVEGEGSQEGAEDPEYIAPNPAANPRNQVLKEIAASVDAQHKVEFAETVDTIDDEGNITAAEAPAEPAPVVEPSAPAQTPEPPAQTANPPASPLPYDPAKLYKVTIDGQEVEVPGQKLWEAGVRTFQKETAADYRLELASKLLREAEERARASATAPAKTEPAPSTSKTDAELAEAIQFGTIEQASAALKELRGRDSVSPENLSKLVQQQASATVRDMLLYNEAEKFAHSEYPEIFANDYLTRLFVTEEQRRRTPVAQGGEGDNRPYKDLYKSIGDDLRKALNLQKPAAATPTPSETPAPGTSAARAALKAATPPVPRTASSRLEAAEASAKAKTPSEIIAAMSAARGMNRLTTNKGVH